MAPRRYARSTSIQTTTVSVLGDGSRPFGKTSTVSGNVLSSLQMAIVIRLNIPKTSGHSYCPNFAPRLGVPSMVCNPPSAGSHDRNVPPAAKANLSMGLRDQQA